MARGRNRKKTSRFKGAVSRNAAKQRQGRGAQHLRLPKGVALFKEQPKTRVQLDILPYVVSDKNHPDRDDEFEIAVPGELWYKRPYWLHRAMGANGDSMVCLQSVGKKCPICEYRNELLNDGADWSDDTVKALKPSLRNLYVVVPRSHKNYEEVPHIWDVSQFLFQDFLNEEVEENEQYETFPDLEDGYTLKIRFAEETFAGNKYAKVSRIDLVERNKPIPESILDEVPDLDGVLIIPNTETMEEVFFGGAGTADPDDDGDGTDEDERPRRRQRTTRRRDDNDDDDDGDNVDDVGDDDGDDGNDGDEKPAPRQRRRRNHSTKKEDPECPSGYRFGVDIDLYDECDDCPIWEQCMAANSKGE